MFNACRYLQKSVPIQPKTSHILPKNISKKLPPLLAEGTATQELQAAGQKATGSVMQMVDEAEYPRYWAAKKLANDGQTLTNSTVFSFDATKFIEALFTESAGSVKLRYMMDGLHKSPLAATWLFSPFC